MTISSNSYLCHFSLYLQKIIASTFPVKCIFFIWLRSSDYYFFRALKVGRGTILGLTFIFL